MLEGFVSSFCAQVYPISSAERNREQIIGPHMQMWRGRVWGEKTLGDLPHFLGLLIFCHEETPSLEIASSLLMRTDDI